MPPTSPTGTQDRPTLRERSGRVLARVRAARKRGRFRALRDTFIGIGITLALLGMLYVASDGAWPPILVVESGSMMHGTDETPYGRFGTLDVGDVVFVRDVSDPREVRTWAANGADRYGRPGDVIAFAQDGDRANTTILHRAMAWVDVIAHENGSRTYRVHWVDGEILTYGNAGIYLPALGIDETWGFSARDGYKPTYSGFLTKGDNPASNSAADQVVGISRLVQPSWIEGRVYGEVPWIGLLRLLFQWDQTNLASPGWVRVGNGFAPVELWTCLFVVVATIILVPLTWDTQRALRERRRRRKAWREEQRRLEAQHAARRQAEDAERRRRAEERARRGPVEFKPVTR